MRPLSAGESSEGSRDSHRESRAVELGNRGSEQIERPRYRPLTQAALWILFAGGAGILLVFVPVNVAFKLWSIGSAGLSIALLRHLPSQSAYRGVANGYGLMLATTVATAGAQLLNHPFLPLCALGFPVAVLLAIRGTGLARVGALSAAVVTAAFGIAELIELGSAARGVVVTEIVDRESGRRIASDSFSVPDTVRGFAGRPNSVVRVRFRRAGTLVYDATYTLDSRGRREISNLSPGERNVLFLGDSFAFGEGVDDADTAPALLAGRAPQLRPLNLGFKAYGPHQALATVEAGLEQSDVPIGMPAASVYYATFDLSRAAGRAFWDSAGPHYVLTAEGALVHQGPFSADRTLRLVALLNRSYLLRELIRNRLNREQDLSLFVAILERTGRLLEERHRGPFVALLWPPSGDRQAAAAVERLQSRGIDAHTAQDVIPDFERLRSSLELADGHPSPEGQARIAEYLDKRLSSAWH